MKTERRTELEMLAKKLNVPNFWNMKDETLTNAIEQAKKGEKVTEAPDKFTDPVVVEVKRKDTPAPFVEPEPEPEPEPIAKATIEFEGGILKQKSIPVAETDKFVENTLAKGFKIVLDGKVRVYSPHRIIKIDITGLPS